MDECYDLAHIPVQLDNKSGKQARIFILCRVIHTIGNHSAIEQCVELTVKIAVTLNPFSYDS